MNPPWQSLGPPVGLRREDEMVDSGGSHCRYLLRLAAVSLVLVSTAAGFPDQGTSSGSCSKPNERLRCFQPDFAFHVAALQSVSPGHFRDNSRTMADFPADMGVGAPFSSSQPNTSDQPAFREGHTDRRNWEMWFARQSGTFREGAEFWAGHRGDRSPPHCAATGDIAFRAGCEAAKNRLTGSDRRRHMEPDYRAGWNSPLDEGNSTQALQQPTQPNQTTQNNAAPPVITTPPPPVPPTLPTQSGAIMQPGLWSVSETQTVGGRGLSLNGVKCFTAEQVSQIAGGNGELLLGDPGGVNCQVSSRVIGNRIVAGGECRVGNGGLVQMSEQITFDNPQHLTGQASVNQTLGPNQLSMGATFEAHRVGSC